MLKFEPFTNKTNYIDQLGQIDATLAEFASLEDPDVDLQRDSQVIWDKYQSANPVGISTEDLTNNPIDNLEAVPFRTFLESQNMPFSDDVIYLPEDISQSDNITEILANTMANAYQLGNLAQSIFVAFPYLQKFTDQEKSGFSQEVQEFIDNLTTSGQPFEMVSFPFDQIQEGVELLDMINQKQQVENSSIVLHPLAKSMTIIFINANNIDGMSVMQVSDQLQKLANIRKTVKRIKMDKLITSPQVDRNQDKNRSSDRNGDGSSSRSNRVGRGKIKKLNSTKKITAVITHELKHHLSNKRSRNVTVKVKKTYNKPNRREPENDFKAGKTKRRIYRPNIHLYLDTSGSMSIDQYRSGISAAIDIAKQLGTDIYISSFSDTLAEAVLLDRIKSQSTAKLLRRALKIPVVQGGTDFENVYEDIHLRAKLADKQNISPEYSIILSDMEFWFSPGYKAPKEVNNTLHLMIDGYDDGRDFKTSAYNAGITRIDKTLFKI